MTPELEINMQQHCHIIYLIYVKHKRKEKEKVQRRASKCALGNVGQDMPYEERLKLLKWPSLEQRRLFSSLIECYKTINRLNGLDPSAFFTFAHDFRPLTLFRLGGAFRTPPPAKS